MKGNRRNPGGPVGSIVRSTMGVSCEGRPEHGIEPKPGVGRAHTTGEAPEGNEGVEGRGPLEGVSLQKAEVRTQSRAALPPHLQRVHEAAKRDRKLRFTALLHHVNTASMERTFRRLRRNASAGVDGETVEEYEQDLSANLERLCARVHTRRYRPRPLRRVYISKPDGSRRPLGIPALEDKIVQGAVAEVLSAIYEADFLGFSYGFRPGRSPHQALTALHTAVMTQRVNWVLDADIRRLFDSVDHEWLLRMMAHRIADPRVLQLIRRWLKAGVLEDGQWSETVEGTPQGAGISPMLSNVFLHYVLDLWVHQWRKRPGRGRVAIVRYSDDFVMGFERQACARRMLADLQKRLARFGLTLHEEKTRLIEFGRLPAIRRAEHHQRRPETFAFLGFTHYCGWTRDGRFVMKRKTQRQRLHRKLKLLRAQVRTRMHQRVALQHRWLCAVLRGHYGYYGVTSNFRCLNSFYYEVKRLWFRSLGKRSQRGLTWDRFQDLLQAFPLPPPRIIHRCSR